MSTVLATSPGPAADPLSSNARLTLGVFAATILLSALLLFSVQPIFAKIVLPKLGGSPSVWAVSMCFFQAVLLAGYGYAHLLSRWLGARLAMLVHLGLCAGAVMALPFGMPDMGDPPAGDAYLWLIGVLTVGVGLPFFALSANAPLLQAWFATSGHRDARDPYFLYGASNLGSLVALLSYPFLIEPLFGLSEQARVWQVGFVVLACAILACGLLSGRETLSSSAEPSAGSAAAPTWSARLGWVCLSFVPSGILVAFSSFISTDIASAPLLWVLPLAAFLLTFMLVFRDEPVIPHWLMLVGQPVLVCATMLGQVAGGQNGVTISALAGSAAFFVTMMVCHRELYERRPASGHLTEFYMWMSLGGVLGGVFAAIAAPQMFNTLLELPLLLVAGLLCRPGVLARLRDREELRRFATIVGAGTAVIVVAGMVLHAGLLGTSVKVQASAAIALILICAVLIIRRMDKALELPLAALGLVAFVALPSPQSMGHSERSFFGVHRVSTTPDGEARLLLHGTTLHGVDRLKHADGRPIEHPIPATYFHAQSPMALGIDVVRQLVPAGRTYKVGVIGLGAGSLACYAKAGESWRFYEIDPLVVKIARDPKHFRFLPKCQPDADVVMGDARLTLAKEPAARFDYLVVDAFSSDAVPVHLLTREALALYLDKVGPNGLVALHISNRHLDLAAVGSALVASMPDVHGVLAIGNGDLKVYNTPSVVMLVSRDKATIAAATAATGARPLPTPSIRPWTDERSDILSVLWQWR